MSRRTMLAPILPNPIIASCMTSSPLNLSRGPQPFHGVGNTFAVIEYRRPRHQDVGTGGNRQRSGGDIDPAVDLEVAPRFDPIDHPACTTDLGERRVQEMLMPESRVHRHDQHYLHTTLPKIGRARRMIDRI